MSSPPVHVNNITQGDKSGTDHFPPVSTVRKHALNAAQPTDIVQPPNPLPFPEAPTFTFDTEFASYDDAGKQNWDIHDFSAGLGLFSGSGETDLAQLMGMGRPLSLGGGPDQAQGPGRGGRWSELSFWGEPVA